MLIFKLAAFQARFVVLLFVSLVGWPAVAADNAALRIHSGLNLVEPLSIDVSVAAESYVVVRAVQRTADYQISLYERDQTEALKQVNLSAHKAVDELLLIEATDCQYCRIELSADSSLDQRGRYSLSVETHSLASASGSTSINERAALAALRVISRVGELNYQLNHPVAGDQTDFLAKADGALSTLLSEVPNNEHTRHAHFLALQIAGMRRQSSKVAELARQVAATSQHELSLYSIQAVFELARQAETTAEKHALFRRGMLDAEAISEPILYAKGANYLAISLTRQGRFEQSLQLFKEVYDIYSREQNLGALMFALHNLSWANQRAGHLPQAIAYAAQQKLLAQEYQARSNEIWALYNMAIGYAELGDHYEADQFLDQALDRYGELAEPEQRDNDGIYGAILEERAESLLRLGDVASARDLARIIKAHYEAANFNRNLANFGMLEGKIAIADKRFEDARSGLQASLDYFQQSQEARSAGLAHFRLAQLELTQGDAILASQHNVDALDHLSGTEDYLSLAKVFSQSVAVLLKLGAHLEADTLAQQTAVFVDAFGRDDVTAEFAFQRAKVAQSLGRDADALKWLNDALRIVEVKLPKVKRRDLRQQYLALQKSLFELNIALLVDQGKVEDALRVLESFKARTLKETVSQVKNTDALPTRLRDLRRDLHQQILKSATSWYGDSDNRESSLLANTRSLSRELEKLEVAIASEQEAAVVLDQRSGPQVIPHSTNANEAMLFYFIGQQRSWLWRVDSAGVTLFELPAEAELAPLVQDVKRQVSVHPRLRVGGSAYEFRQSIIELGELLLGSAFTNMELSTVENLTVIPDGPLNGLSFAPLQLSDMEDPLLAYTAIAYAPSYQALVAIERRARRQSLDPRDINVLVVADPIDLTRSDVAFERLPHTVFEAQAIRSILAGRAQVLMGQEATKRNLLAALSNDYSILHFATHGLLNSQTPALSGLVFTSDSEAANFWLAPEISSTDLRANLVMLSACESSIGKEVAGEGLLSLSRAFIEAGANHVIGTLWKVQDAATAELTSGFYSKLLDDSLAISVALQAAQLAVYKNQHNDWRDPYYWAGFQLQGGWQTVTYGSDKSTK